MKTVEIKKMTIENFKGIRSLDVKFSSITEITGDNGTGKTTIADAWSWLIVGKDSAGQEVFKVQPLDENSHTIPKLTTMVLCEVLIDESLHTLKREFKQKWSKPKGTTEEICKGNTSDYYIDEVPYGANEYYKKISDMICPSENFMLCSSITYFNSLDVKNRRKKLIEMAGTPDILSPEEFPNVVAALQKGKTIDEYRKQIAGTIKRLNEDLEKIPLLINENERDLPTTDFEAVRADVASLKKKIANIDAILQRKASANKATYDRIAQMKKQLGQIDNEIFDLETSFRKRINKKTFDIKNRIAEVENDKKIAKKSLAASEKQIDTLHREIDELKTNKDLLIKQWKEVNASEFIDNDMQSECPTCHRPFSKDEMHDKLNQIIATWNEEKISKLKNIEAKGNAINENLKITQKRYDDEKLNCDKYKREIKQIDKHLSALNVEYDGIPTMDALLDNSEYKNLKSRRDLLEAEYTKENEESEKLEDKDIIEEKTKLTAALEESISKLSEEKMIVKVKKRRDELESKAVSISDKIAEQQKKEDEVLRYSKRYIELVEGMVASKFNLVKFAMFEPNLTNDGEKEICECLVGGVPYTGNLNSGARINAGVDIINAFQKYNEIILPVFIDNKETVTKLIPTEAQLITIEVVKNAPLKVTAI